MINPHIKNKRTGFHEDILNRSAHYMKLINSRAAVDSVWTKGSLKAPLRNNVQECVEISRAENNLRLMNKILNIEKRNTRYDT
jgi:hypothetical protein